MDAERKKQTKTPADSQKQCFPEQNIFENVKFVMHIDEE